MPIIRKIKSYLPSILLAVVIATAFFIHEGFPLIPDNLYQAKTNWEAAKAENTKALDALKQLNLDLHQGKITLDEFAKQQPALVEAYTQINQEKDELYERYEEGKAEAEFLQFETFQLFLGEFGWALGLFLYAFFNVLYIFYLKKAYPPLPVRGKLLLHGTLLFIGLFYTCYVFYSEDDFPRTWYFIAMALCAISLTLAGKYLVQAYFKRMAALRQSIDHLIHFVFRTRREHYRRVAVKALYAEEHKTPLPSPDTVEDNANAFEEDFYNTLEKVEV